MSHVVLEGPDGGGKSTLARKLCAAYGYAYHHEGQPPADALHHYAWLLLRPEPTVFDRLHLGETVYGPILRGHSQLGAYEVKLLQRLVVGTGSVVIICRPPFKTCEANLHARELLTPAQRYVAYTAWLNTTVYPHMSYDYTRVSAETPLWPLNSLQRPCCPPGVVGAPDARLLLVGERVNGPVDAAFFGAGGASRYLNDALVDAGYEEGELAFTNAYAADGTARNLKTLIADMTTLRVVIALGRVAWRRVCGKSFCYADALPHPAYWARFHHRERAKYVEALASFRRYACSTSTGSAASSHSIASADLFRAAGRRRATS